jgi:uncharacterized protein YdeI (BOF family)
VKKVHFFSLVATVAVLFGAISWGGLLQAQQTSSNSKQPPSQAQQPDSQNPPQQQPPSQSGQQQPPDQAQPDAGGSQTFIGTVVKQGDKYMFRDDATGTIYDIDHQDEVSKFAGRKVRVHGTLDPKAKMIHVQ